LRAALANENDGAGTNEHSKNTEVVKLVFVPVTKGVRKQTSTSTRKRGKLVILGSGID